MLATRPYGGALRHLASRIEVPRSSPAKGTTELRLGGRFLISRRAEQQSAQASVSPKNAPVCASGARVLSKRAGVRACRNANRSLCPQRRTGDYRSRCTRACSGREPGGGGDRALPYRELASHTGKAEVRNGRAGRTPRRNTSAGRSHGSAFRPEEVVEARGKKDACGGRLPAAGARFALAKAARRRQSRTAELSTGPALLSTGPALFGETLGAACTLWGDELHSLGRPGALFGETNRILWGDRRPVDKRHKLLISLLFQRRQLSLDY
jgi:hypothetical protein